MTTRAAARPSVTGGGRPHPPGRALLVAHRLAAPDATGIGRYVRELATALATAAPTAGWQIGVAATPEVEPVDWLPADVEATTLGRNRRRTHLAWTALRRPTLERLGVQPDLVHVLSPFTPIPTARPVVWTLHDTWYLHERGWAGRIERTAGARAIRQAAEGGGLVITPTEVTAAAVEADAGIPRDRIRVVPEGVAAGFHAAPGGAARAAVLARHGVREGRYLLAVGGISPRKNLGVVAEALRRRPPAPPGPELLVVGPPGPGAGPVQDALSALGPRVRLAGFVPDGDLPALVAGARAVVHPSRDEGFGLVPIEAMAAGAPVLAGEAPAVAEVTRGAACVLPDDPDAWSDAIGRLSRDEGWRADLVAAGRARAATFTWARAAAGTLAVYAEATA